MKRLSYILIILPALMFGQRNLPLNREWGLVNESYRDLILPVSPDSALVRTGVTNPNEENYVQDPSCFKPYITKPFIPLRDRSKKWFLRKLTEESLIVVKDSADKFNLTVDPLLQFEAGTDFADRTHEVQYKNTRGFLVRGNIGEQFVFESSFYENQAVYPDYIDKYIIATDNLFPQTSNYDYNVIPGQGRSKKYKQNGYDYSMASGYISWSPGKHLNIQAGHGKHFVGDGYRSLLLSDNAYNYPYARITTSWKNFQYTNLYASFINLTNGGASSPAFVERLFQKKTASFQMLSGTFFRRLQLGIFQGMIWEAADTNNSQHLSFNTFNPVIGVNSGVFGLDHSNNILLGATWKIKVLKSISLYGQFVLDEIYDANDGAETSRKNGYQVGMKYHNVFTLRNLNFQIEYNTVRPYTYAADNAYQSYTHYNQALAHPMGANFTEAVGFVNYIFKGFFIQLKGIYAQKGVDTLNRNFGGNVFRPSGTFPISQKLDNVHTLGGLKTTITYQDIQFGYLVNPVTNLNLYIGFTNRFETTYKGTVGTQLIYFGLRTSLTNSYFDF
jgi:hypothetical protein